MLEKLSERMKNNELPVVVLTMSNKDEDKKRALGLGASDYLLKNEYTIDEVLDVVLKHMPSQPDEGKETEN